MQQLNDYQITVVYILSYRASMKQSFTDQIQLPHIYYYIGSTCMFLVVFQDICEESQFVSGFNIKLSRCNHITTNKTTHMHALHCNGRLF